MKKIKLLFFILLALLLFNVFKVYTYALNYDLLQIDNDASAIYTLIFYLTALVLFFVAQIFIVLGLRTFIRKGIFSSKASIQLKIGGILLTVFGISETFLRLYQLWSFREVLDEFLNLKLISAVENGYSIILGIVLVILSDIIKNGWIIKSENDLTI